MVAVMHERARGLTWGISEAKGAAARAGLVGGGRKEGWVSRCSTSVSGQSVG
jgi:hypothetical protein